MIRETVCRLMKKLLIVIILAIGYCCISGPLFQVSLANSATKTSNPKILKPVAHTSKNYSVASKMIITCFADSPKINIVSSTSSICKGTPITFTATIINGGSAPIYQWRVNGLNVGTNNPTYTRILYLRALLLHVF
jgi:hypothetical protein